MKLARNRRGWAALLGAFALVAGVWAMPVAEAGQERIEIDQVDVSDYPTVELTVTAPPSLLGVTVPPSDWRLLEAGSGRAVNAVPLRQEALSVVLVIDTSGSMAGLPLIGAKTAALDFLDRLPPRTAAAVVGFGDTPEVKIGFSTDHDEIAIAIDALTAQGETALYDAVGSALALLDDAPGDRTGVVVVTDGGDTVSTTDLGQTAIALSGAETSFTAVELLTGETDRQALDELAAAASGQVIAADDPGALAGVYSQIADQLANQYRLTYRSVTDDENTEVEVVVDSFGIEAYGASDVALPPLDARPATDTADEDDEPEAAGVAPVARVADAPGPLGQTWAIWLGAGFVALALLFAGAVLFAPHARARSLRSDTESDADTDYGEVFHEVADRATEFSGRILDRAGLVPDLDQAIDRAGLEIRPGELVAIVAAASLFSGAVFGLLGGPFIALVFFVLPIAIAPLVLRTLSSRRQDRFADQLADTLLLFSSTLRAGYGLSQAIDTVAGESPEPTASEFGRVVLEVRLGRPADDALERLGQRMNNEDFGWVVDAVRIQRDVGGNLAEVLDHIENTIRARARIRRQVRALTAEGRLSAIVLLSLPVAIGLLIYSSNPDYIDPLFTETIGRVMLGAGLVLMLVGGLWLRKLVEPEF